MREWLLRYKNFLLISMVLLVVLGASWQIFASKMEQALQATIVQRMNQQLNGRLKVGAIDLSLLGWIKFRDVSLIDGKGSLVAQSPNVNIRYQWSNLADGNLDLSRIETVSIEEAEVWLEEINGVSNWNGLLKDTTDSSNFRGKIQLARGKANVKTSLASQVIEGVTGFFDFQSYPNLGIDIKGTINQALLTLKGHWGESRPFELAIGTSELDLASLSSLLASTSESRLAGGSLKNVQIIAIRDENNTLYYRAEGEFFWVSLQGKIPISEGTGKFSCDQTSLEFQDLSLLIAGQQAHGHGKISLGTDMGDVDFTLSLPDVDPAVLNSSIAIQRPLALQIRVGGPLAQPAVTGSFTLPLMTVSDMSVSTVAGNFGYINERLNLQQVQGAAHSGTLFIAGNVLTDSGSYELDVSGQGMNSSQLTDKDVQGPLSFTGHATGQGETAVTRGNFIINDGKAYGLSFKTLTGQFIKRGTSTDISGIAVSTPLGSFYPEELSHDALERINQKQLPTSQEALKKVVTDKLLEQLFR